MVSYSNALSIIHASIERELPAETVPLVLSLGRVLAGPIIAGEDIPRSPNSAMDGYAVRAEDLATASVESPARLRVIGEAAAGSLFAGTVGHGEAVRIMTGAIVPEGATGVIEVEATYEADGMVEARRSIAMGESIRRAGEDLKAGTEALAAGRRITPGDIGVLASLGVVNVPVKVKPKIGILSTGNEIVEAFRTPGPGQIRNSSSPALYAFCAELGGEPIDLGIAGDDREELEEKLEEGLRYDILLTTGGVSAGAYDLVQKIFPELGVSIRFHKVRIRPGKPVLFGTYGEGNEQSLVFGLPGNPVSTLVTFREFVAPAIRQLLGEKRAHLRLRATLSEPLRKGEGQRQFLRGIASRDEHGELVVRRTGTQSSGAMSSMSLANCLIILEEEITTLEPGQPVEIELL